MAKTPIRTSDEARDLIDTLHAALAAARPFVVDATKEDASPKRRAFVRDVLGDVDQALAAVEGEGRP